MSHAKLHFDCFSELLNPSAVQHFPAARAYGSDYRFSIGTFQYRHAAQGSTVSTLYTDSAI